MAYLNENNFRQHEGTNVNRSTIEQFIDRKLSERNSQAKVQADSKNLKGVERKQNENINLDFLPPTKVMQQATRFKPLSKDEYEGYKKFHADDNNDEDVEDIIKRLAESHPGPRSLVGTVNPIQWREQKGTRISSKPGMKELQNIVFNLYRDVVRVKNAISPQGAGEIVRKHNSKAKPEAHWRLETDDVNAYGVPDIIIKNARGEPTFVNGYTTKQSDYPETLAYYSEFPTRDARKTMSKRKFINEHLYDIETRYKADNSHDLGDTRANNGPEWYDTARKKYRLTNIDKARLSPYRRFQSFIIQPKLNDILGAMELSNYQLKGPLLAKVTSSVWNNSVVIPIAQANGVSPEDLDKFRKSKAFKELSDQKVTEILDNVHNNQAFASEYEHEISSVISDCMQDLDAKHFVNNFLD